jgi:hypothetical protein
MMNAQMAAAHPDGGGGSGGATSTDAGTRSKDAGAEKAVATPPNKK